MGRTAGDWSPIANGAYMKHFLTRELFRYWNTLAPENEIPLRKQIEPKYFKAVLPNVFMLERFDDNHYNFRLAGTELGHLYGREFRDQNFLRLWDGASQKCMKMLLQQAHGRGSAAHAIFQAETIFHEKYDCEVLLLPLLDSLKQPTRIIGCILPLETTLGIGNRKFVKQIIKDAQLVDREASLKPSEGAMSLLKGSPPPYLRLVHSST